MSAVDRAAAFQDDILAEPETLERLLDAYAAPNGPLNAVPGGGGERPRVLLVGLGSSRFAAVDAATRLRASGIASWAEIAGTDGGTEPSCDLVVVAVSASGRTAEVVDTIARHRGTSLVIGVTNSPEEPVGRNADVVLPLLAGTETSGIACRTWQATTVVLELLGRQLAGLRPDADTLRPTVPALTALIEGRADWLDPAADLLDRAPAVAVLGPVQNAGVAEQVALMLREAPRLPASAHETGEWLHTAIYTALPGYRAVLLASSPRDAEVVRTIRGRGGATITVGALAGAPAELSSTLRIGVPDAPAVGAALLRGTVGELLAAALWTRASTLLKGT